MIRTKSDFGEALALYHIFMHLFVARAIAGLAGGRVENDLATGLAAGGIVMEATPFRLKRSLHCMHMAGERNIRGALRDVELQYDIVRRLRLGREPLAEQQRDEEVSDKFFYVTTRQKRGISVDQTRSSCHPRETPFVR